MTVEEQSSIGEAIDIRGTKEARNRINAVRVVVHFLPEEMVMAEMYGENFR